MTVRSKNSVNKNRVLKVRYVIAILKLALIENGGFISIGS